MSDATKSSPFELMEDGKIVRNYKGKQTVLGHYDEEAKHLEFENKETSIKYRSQILTVIGADGEGTHTSGRTIRTMSVKGEKRDEPKANIPPRPKMDPNLGDATPALVEWLFKYYPKDAYIRYGVKLDGNGEPIRAAVRRKLVEIVDNRNSDDDNLEEIKVGAKSWTKGPITQGARIISQEDGIIASRATHMTFLPEEAVNYQPGVEGDEDL